MAAFNFMTNTATIIISEKDGFMHFSIKHDPAPKGPRETWPTPSRMADAIIRNIINEAKKAGIDPELEAYKHSITGEITTRSKDKP